MGRLRTGLMRLGYRARFRSVFEKSLCWCTVRAQTATRKELMSKTQIKKATEPVTPMKFMNDLWAARLSLTLIAAIDMDIFTLIAKGKRTADSVAKGLKAPKRGVERLLDALVGMGYLTKRGTELGLTPVADTFLVSG